jgi:lipopolysaccharide biosynthesis glycosyltransferase
MRDGRIIYLGFDQREAAAFAVARASIQRRLSQPIRVVGLVLDDLRAQGLYTRAHEERDGRIWDVISDAPMSTEFAISRFLVPHLAQYGWALFLDADMLVRVDLAQLFDAADPDCAVMVVKHDYHPPVGEKMDGQQQTMYPRKNWSSLVLFNCNHPANDALTPAMVNMTPGRDLHRFHWLTDDLIGTLDPKWNWLVGHSDPQIDPAIVHFTEGGPWFPQYSDVAYADAWRAELAYWAR